MLTRNWRRLVARMAQCHVPKARVLLPGFIDRIVLRPSGTTLEALVRGNLAPLLPFEGRPLGDNRGAGGPARQFPTRVYRIPVAAAKKRGCETWRQHAGRVQTPGVNQ